MPLPEASHLPASLPSLQDGHGAGAQDKWGEAGRPGLIQPGEEKAKGEAIPAACPPLCNGLH